MLTWLKAKQRSILGIDISSTSVKMVQMARNGGSYAVEAYGSASLPLGAMEGYQIKDPAAVADVIKTLFAQKSFTCKQAAIAVPDSTAISKVIQVSEGLTEAEIEELVTIEADKYIPYPIEEINLDFKIIGPSQKNPAMQDVLLVASRSENVNSRTDVLSRAGLNPTIVDVESYAIERVATSLVNQMPAQGVNKIIAILDVGAVYTHLFVLHNLKIIFVREEEFGGKQLLEGICEKYKMKPEEARKALDLMQLPEDYETTVLQPFKESILLQIKRALQFFFSTSHHTFVDGILLAGGVAQLADLAPLLQESINIPTAVVNPLEQIQIELTVDKDKILKDSPGLLIACGLGFREKT